jgi:hypothetical protein
MTRPCPTLIPPPKRGRLGGGLEKYMWTQRIDRPYLNPPLKGEVIWGGKKRKFLEIIYYCSLWFCKKKAFHLSPRSLDPLSP